MLVCECGLVSKKIRLLILNAFYLGTLFSVSFLNYVHIIILRFKVKAQKIYYKIQKNIQPPAITIILIINSVIRPFPLTHFLKNYTTNFDETLHTL